MASMNLFAVLAIICIVIPRVAFATEYIVGDDSGWTIKFDYAAWAKDKEFRVGDKLVFAYPVGGHNVHKVNATGFKECIVPPESEALSSGNDVITLATPGNKWYLCGVGQHCTDGGQKLSIAVLPAFEETWQAPSPAPASPSSATGIATSRYQIFIVALITIAMAIIV
ncbi:blue copper protein-like [Thalictrum thalictroides]|uniref:Blue copper protein-like n=1 Tax=Thalictrum thalictroides TaxID=46969 RepID=A0A7J6WZA6_THATH|nr:blue copper protein-like [Thalictrum thalictroides]